MRIMYDNLIDDLNASTLTALSTATSYSILDIQDQRLTTVWKSGSATSQTVLCELDTFPDFPDGTAGSIIYRSDFSAGVDGFNALYSATNMSIYSSNGGLYLDAAASIEVTSIGAYKVIAWGTGSTCLVKFETDADLSSVQYYNGTSYTSMTTFEANDRYSYANASMIRGSTYSNLSVVFNYASTAIAATKMIVIAGVYVGNGTYTTTVEDLSGNGRHATVYGATPVDTVAGRGFIGDGIDDQLSLMASFVNTVSFGGWIQRTLAATIQYPMSFGASSTAERIAIRFDASDNLTLSRFVSAAATVTIIGADTGTARHIFVAYDGTNTKVYVSGILVSTISGAIDTTSNGIFRLLTRAKDVAANFFGGTIADPRIYNRALEDWEIENIYNKISWVGEMDGLVGWWDVGHGLGINTAAILGHNLLPGTTLQIQGNSSNNWGDPEVNEQITVNENTCLKFLSDTYYLKYWRFLFGSQGDLEIGRLWLGDYITINPSSLLDFKVTKKRSDTVIHGKNRQKWASVGVGWRRFDLSFPPTDEEMIYQISELYDTVGNHSSFIFCNFDTIRDYCLVEPCYVSIEGDFSFVHTNRMRFTYSLSMEEEM